MDFDVLLFWIVLVAVLVGSIWILWQIFAAIRSKLGVLPASAVTILVLFFVLNVLFPPVGNYRKRARETSCASNLKQIGLGFIQYSQDYDNRYPNGPNHWAGAIYSYEKSTGIYHCPEDNVAEPDANPPLYRISYAMNANLLEHTDGDQADPAHTVLACECAGARLGDFVDHDNVSQYTTGWAPNTAWGGIRLGTNATTLVPTRHDPALEFLACDGHVKLLRPKQVSSGIDNASVSGAQGAVHAAGTKALAAGRYTLTFSER